MNKIFNKKSIKKKTLIIQMNNSFKLFYKNNP